MGELTCAKLPRYHINLEHAHFMLARSCMCYISICLKRAQRPTLVDVSHSSGSSQPKVAIHSQSQPLLDYALDDALDHFGHLVSTFKTALGDIRILAEDIQRHSWIWDHVYTPARWKIDDNKPHWPTARHDLLLYILVAFASNSFMSAFFRRTPLKPKAGTNPLVYAAYFNKEEHARILLSRGARLDHRGWETVGYCQSLPIEVAFRKGNYAMVIRFVEEGSTIPPHIFTGSFFKRLQFSDISQTIPTSVTRVLLQTDEFAENISGCLIEAGLRAIKMSNQLLIFRDATEQDLIAITRRFIQVTDEHLTPNLIRVAFLRLAVAKGYFHAARYLLTTLDTPLPSDLLVTLHHYSGRWKTALMIQFLVDNGADVLTRTSDGDSVLHVILWAPGGDLRHMVNDANEYDILEAVKLVVRRGCDPLEADSRGKIPLHIAIEQGYISVARYLVALGAPLPTNILRTLGRDRWRWITVPVIRFLVENDVDVVVHTGNGDSVLHIVLQISYDEDQALEAMKFLVGHGCNPLEANSRGSTPLRIVIERGYISVARYIITLGPRLPPDLLETLNHDQLSWYWNAVPVIHFLIENGVDVLEHNDERGSALHMVLRCSTDEKSALEAVKVLVGRGCDPLEADSRGNTPLHIAVGQGYTSAAQYLLDIGAPVPPDLLVTLDRDSFHRCTAATIRFLVENGVNVLACTDDGDSVLHILLQSLYNRNQALEVVKLLVNYGCNPLVADSHGNTPLHIAVKQGHISVARYLLTLGARDQSVTWCHHSHNWSNQQHPPDMSRLLVERGANALAHTINGNSLLHTLLQSLSCDNEALEAVKLLVGYDWDPLVVNSYGKTPLHIAIEGGHVAVAQYLLTLGAPVPHDLLVSLNRNQSRRMFHFLIENGVDVLARTDRGDSALHVVLRCFNDDDSALEAVKALVDHGCDPLEADSHGATPLHIAIKRGDISVAGYLLTLGAHLPPDFLVSLKSFIQLRDTARMICFLVDSGANVLARDDDGNSALHIMPQFIYEDDKALEVVKLLISYGCDPLEANLCGHTPLDIAVQRGHVSAARYLLTLGASVPPDILVASTSLMHFRSTADMIPFLVDSGAKVLAHDDDGNSAVHIMPQFIYDDKNALEAVELLVGYGCDPLEANLRGRTPLDIAVQQGHVSVARYLITLGASVPPDILVASTSESPIRFQDTTDIIPFLVKNGVNLLTRTDDGDSVFHIMLQSIYDDATKALEAVKLLVSYGCDPLEANLCGRTPLDIAIQQGHVSVARYLITLGASVPPDILVTSTFPIHFHTGTDMIPFLVKNGVNLLARTDDGDSVFHIMLQSISYDARALEAVKLLVSYGCDPLEANLRGRTPLHIAVGQDHILVAKYLLSLGAHPPPDLLFTLDRDEWNCTENMIRFLFKNGVSVLAHSGDGDSVFHVVLESIYDDDKALMAVKLLVSCGCDPLEANIRGDTPLHIAVLQGHISVARYLLNLGAYLPPNLLVTLDRDEWSCTARMIRFLFKNGVNVLARTSDGDSVLHIVLESAYDDGEALTAMKFLISHGCDPLEANLRGITPLHVAVKAGHVSAARYLLTLGAVLPPDLLVTLTGDSSGWSTVSMIHFLYENGVNLSAHASNGDPVLHRMLQCSNDDQSVLEALKLLVGYGCHPLEANSRGDTPLHIAVERGHVTAARHLLTLGACVPPDILLMLNRDQSLWNTAPMIHFLFANQVKFLTHASDGNSVLHIALQCFNDDKSVMEAAKLLVSYGCDPLETNSRGEIPLHFAARQSNVSVANYLIQQGANVLTKASNGDTVLHFATSAVYPYPQYRPQDVDSDIMDAVKFYVRCGCEPAVPNDRGTTPLHNVVDLGRVKTMKYLLSLNILLPTDILFTAIKSDNNSTYRRHIVETLVTSGCDTQTPNSEGVTPLQAAIIKGKVDVVEYLLSDHNIPFEDLLSATELAPQSVQSDMRRLLSNRRTRSESPSLPPAKRAKHS